MLGKQGSCILPTHSLGRSSGILEQKLRRKVWAFYFKVLTSQKSENVNEKMRCFCYAN